MGKKRKTEARKEKGGVLIQAWTPEAFEKREFEYMMRIAVLPDLCLEKSKAWWRLLLDGKASTRSSATPTLTEIGNFLGALGWPHDGLGKARTSTLRRRLGPGGDRLAAKPMWLGSFNLSTCSSYALSRLVCIYGHDVNLLADGLPIDIRGGEHQPEEIVQYVNKLMQEQLALLPSVPFPWLEKILDSLRWERSIPAVGAIDLLQQVPVRRAFWLSQDSVYAGQIVPWFVRLFSVLHTVAAVQTVLEAQLAAPEDLWVDRVSRPHQDWLLIPLWDLVRQFNGFAARQRNDPIPAVPLVSWRPPHDEYESTRDEQFERRLGQCFDQDRKLFNNTRVGPDRLAATVQWAFDYACYTCVRSVVRMDQLCLLLNRFPHIQLKPVVLYDLFFGRRPKGLERVEDFSGKQAAFDRVLDYMVKTPALGRVLVEQISWSDVTSTDYLHVPHSFPTTCLLLELSSRHLIPAPILKLLISRHAADLGVWPRFHLIKQLWEARLAYGYTIRWQSVESLLFLLTTFPTGGVPAEHIYWRQLRLELLSRRKSEMDYAWVLPSPAFAIRQQVMHSACTEFIRCLDRWIAEGQAHPGHLRDLLGPDRPQKQFELQHEAETKAQLVDPIVVPRLIKPRTTTDSNKLLPDSKTTERRTIVIGFESILAWLIDYHNENGRAELFQKADIIFYPEGFRPARVIVDPASLVGTLAERADRVDGEWSPGLHSIFPIIVRPGAGQFLQRLQQAGYELAMWSHRSEHKTNTALHPIDPDQQLFTLSHRVYHEDKASDWNRDPSNVIFLGVGAIGAAGEPKNNYIPLQYIPAYDVTKRLLSGQLKSPDPEWDRLWTAIFEPLSRLPGDIRTLLPALLK